jgi:flagella basal body P-ring formation protein FlgA
MKAIVCMWLTAYGASACTAIEGERIVARDLAATIPSFLTVAPETDLGPSPAPGIKRILSRAQLARLASSEGVSVAELPESVCVERLQVVLEPKELLASLEGTVRELFPGQEVRVEILDYVRHPMPPGGLSFRRQGILGGAAKAMDAPLLWRGSLTTASKRSLPIWAKAKILIQRACWSARTDLAAGDLPREDQFERSDLWLNPFLAVAECADPLEKKVRLRRPIRAGQRLIRSDLAIVPPVRRGESVQASLAIGTAKISFDAVSEMDGGDGQSVFVKREGRRLRGRVTGAGAVEIIPGNSK